MNKLLYRYLFALGILGLFHGTSCKPARDLPSVGPTATVRNGQPKTPVNASEPEATSGATSRYPIQVTQPVLVYMTRTDYRDKVPVTLSADKKTIIAYPAPSDIYYNGLLAYPTVLTGGYLLDNRGVDVNTAFLDLTYEEYSQWTQVPPADSLLKHLLDVNPITALYSCNCQRDTALINGYIRDGTWPDCKRLK